MTSLAEVLVIGFVVLVALAGAALAVRMRRGGKGPERARPSYRGPDPTMVEEELRRLLDAQRAARGGEPQGRDPRLDEIARHHAHWMSVHRRVTHEDDQGRTAAGRRDDLHPRLLGPLDEAVAMIDTAGAEERAAAEALRASLGGDTPWTDALWRAGGLGVAGSPGQLWAALVVWMPPSPDGPTGGEEQS